LGIDGISLLLIALTCVLSPIIIATTHSSTHKVNNYVALLLCLEAAILGVFLARDIFLFYFFFEITLLPAYFLINGWGGAHRVKANFRFFVFTLLGSLFMLLGILYLYYQTPGTHSSQINDLYLVKLSNPTVNGLVFLSLLVAFAVKMPIFPLHSWQPDTYQQAPTQASMILAGLLGKMGTYGLIRILLPIFYTTVIHYQKPLLWACIIGIIYGSIIAIRQSDIKKLIAFSSFAHIGLIAAGIFTNSVMGIQGALVQMVAHGINVVGLFYIADVINKRTNTMNIEEMGGITQSSKSLSIYSIIIVLGSVALPLTNAFVGEFLLLKSIFHTNSLIGIMAGTSIILGAVYMLRMVQKIFFGPKKETFTFADLTWNESLNFLPIVVLILLLGVVPNILLHISEATVGSIQNILQNTLIK
jgi:NADH-quinone oxidoreductase subunit M